MRVRPPGPTLALILLLFALSACTDDPVSPSPVTPSSPTADSSTPSAEASDSSSTEETPEEFLRRWVQVHNEIELTGDTEAFLSMTHNCEYCISFADRIEQVYARGGWVKTDGWTITNISPAERLRSGAWSLKFISDSAPTSYTERSGGAVKHYIGGSGIQQQIELRRFQGAWKLTFLTEIAA